MAREYRLLSSGSPWEWLKTPDRFGGRGLPPAIGGSPLSVQLIVPAVNHVPTACYLVAAHHHRRKELACVKHTAQHPQWRGVEMVWREVVRQ
jgi:hypothetical protein